MLFQDSSGELERHASAVAARGFSTNSSNYEANRPGYTEEADCDDQPQGHVSTANLAVQGFSTNSSNYEANRPGYTEEAVRIIAQAVESVPCLGESIQYQVLELGAGTGKLTQQLVKELPTSTKYLALDPSRNFLDALKQKSLGVETVEGSADCIPLPDNSVQAVVCAQSFHWFSDLDSLKSIHRVLAPGGVLVLVWNKKNFDDGWRKKILEQRFEVMQKFGAPRGVYETGKWKINIDQSPLFSLSKCYDLAGVEPIISLENIISNVTTISAYNALPSQERETYIEKLRNLLMNWPGVDPNEMKIPHTTNLYVYIAQN
ncbi:methyltransferase [Elysia marginata]|uniref:Methyltransferase n=1 Tax=Elysia marginata TaxID=1093978 RepID=A0AAV4ED47_9GAST|nr:methyltransferase [Elysia marginata]